MKLPGMFLSIRRIALRVRRSVVLLGIARAGHAQANPSALKSRALENEKGARSVDEHFLAFRPVEGRTQ